MFQNAFNQKALTQLGGLVGTTLLGFTVTPLVIAAPSNQQNPCPGIYYEEPHNSVRIVPQGCPPNAATTILIQQGRIPANLYSLPGARVNTMQAPLPENRQALIATIVPVAGTVNVRLQNDTNAQVFYQAIGHTDRRLLAGGNNAVLQNLPTPVTITMTREDGGLLEFLPLSSTQPGLLSISLSEAASLSNDQGALTIQTNGQVLLN